VVSNAINKIQTLTNNIPKISPTHYLQTNLDPQKPSLKLPMNTTHLAPTKNIQTYMQTTLQNQKTKPNNIYTTTKHTPTYPNYKTTHPTSLKTTIHSIKLTPPHTQHYQKNTKKQHHMKRTRPTGLATTQQINITTTTNNQNTPQKHKQLKPAHPPTYTPNKHKNTTTKQHQFNLQNKKIQIYLINQLNPQTPPKKPRPKEPHPNIRAKVKTNNEHQHQNKDNHTSTKQHQIDKTHNKLNRHTTLSKHITQHKKSLISTNATPHKTPSQNIQHPQQHLIHTTYSPTLSYHKIITNNIQTKAKHTPTYPTHLNYNLQTYYLYILYSMIPNRSYYLRHQNPNNQPPTKLCSSYCYLKQIIHYTIQTLYAFYLIKTKIPNTINKPQTTTNVTTPPNTKPTTYPSPAYQKSKTKNINKKFKHTTTHPTYLSTTKLKNYKLTKPPTPHQINAPLLPTHLRQYTKPKTKHPTHPKTDINPTKPTTPNKHNQVNTRNPYKLKRARPTGLATHVLPPLQTTTNIKDKTSTPKIITTHKTYTLKPTQTNTKKHPTKKKQGSAIQKTQNHKITLLTTLNQTTDQHHTPKTTIHPYPHIKHPTRFKPNINPIKPTPSNIHHQNYQMNTKKPTLPKQPQSTGPTTTQHQSIPHIINQMKSQNQLTNTTTFKNNLPSPQPSPTSTNPTSKPIGPTQNKKEIDKNTKIYQQEPIDNYTNMKTQNITNQNTQHSNLEPTKNNKKQKNTKHLKRKTNSPHLKKFSPHLQLLLNNVTKTPYPHTQSYLNHYGTALRTRPIGLATTHHQNITIHKQLNKAQLANRLDKSKLADITPSKRKKEITTKNFQDKTTHNHLKEKIQKNSNKKTKHPSHAKHLAPKYNNINQNITKHIKGQKLPQNKHFPTHLLLLRSGDIETNPGPMPNIIQAHPSTHKNRCKMYFIPCTIKLQPEYQQLAKTFAPSINLTHPNHQDAITNYPHLSKYIYQNQHHPPPRILYALIITISPVIKACDQILIQIPEPDWTTTLLVKMTLLQNPPERHIMTTHPYTQFIQTNHNIINPTNTIHKELYNFIKDNEPMNIHIMKDKFPFLPEKLLMETLKHNEPLYEYSHPPPLPNTPPLPTQDIQTTTHNTYFSTWNASSLNTALPNLHQLISHTTNNPAIITIQETKLTATKSTKYIQNLFPQYKLIFNNTHALTRCIQQRIPYTPARGGLLTFINKKYAYPGNITKIPIPAVISPYLQVIEIKNQPLQSWLIIHIYMPSHEEDIRSIPIIQQNITQ
jgi:hypothetical protein